MVFDRQKSSLIRLLEKGRVIGNDMLDFSMIINHRIDVALLQQLCKKVVSQKTVDIDAVCTVAASGIGLSTIIGTELRCPVIFAQKGENPPVIMTGKRILQRRITSPTKGNVISIYLCSEAFEGCKNVLLADDFLFRGATMGALIEMIRELNMEPREVLVFVNKSFDKGWRVVSEDYKVPVRKFVSIDKIETDGRQALLHIDELMFEPCDKTIRVARFILEKQAPF